MRTTLLIGSLLAACLIVGCTDDNEAQRALTDQGFSDITITDRGTVFASVYGCSDSDGAWYSTTANNPAGKRVNMIVCCGGALQFKGCTLRSK